MKKVVFSAMALAIAIGGIAVSKANTHQVTKVFWKLRAGNNHNQALIATAYTEVFSEGGCADETTLCGILAEPASGTFPLRPNLSSDASLLSDLTAIKNGTDLQSNNSGEVYFRD